MKERYQDIYNLVKAIPPGKVATYGQISNTLKLNNPRLVGYALHNNPDPKSIPCHRVVNSKGGLAENFAFGGAITQKELLEKEGVSFKKDNVNLVEHLFSF
ncbi:MAG: MGMT family protein [Candidatus Dojkabacteria bacterium]|nr:MGMT family protein [Candidatus Dojkabacteria bacterium]